MKAAVCVIVKNENLYLDEWVSHYLDINKFDHIFIYDHNDPEGEHIKDYGENVTVIDFRGHEKPCQHVAYEDCYKTYGEEYDIYWEVMDAYINLQEYFKWKEVAEEQIEDARKMEDMYYQKVIEACENCRFSQNKKYLDDFVKSLEP